MWRVFKSSAHQCCLLLSVIADLILNSYLFCKLLLKLYAIEMFLPPFNIQLTPGMVGNKGAENGRKGANSNESNESSEVWVIF